MGAGNSASRTNSSAGDSTVCLPSGRSRAPRPTPNGTPAAPPASGPTPMPPPSLAARTAAVAPLSSEEIVEVHQASVPLPPTTASTSNPRQQHITDTHGTTTPTTEQLTQPSAHHRPLAPAEQQPERVALGPLDATMRHQRHQHGHPSSLPQSSSTAAAAVMMMEAGSTMRTPSPAESTRHPPTVLETAVKKESNNAERIGAAALTKPPAHLMSAEDDVTVHDTAANSRFLTQNGIEEENSLQHPTNDDTAERPQRRRHTQTSPSPDIPENTPKENPHASFCAAGAAVATNHVGHALAYRPNTRSASPGTVLGQYDGLPLTSVQEVLQAKHKVYRICLTGGPCAGKSTMLSAMQSKIPQRLGFRVMCVPEAATLLVTGGMQWDGSITVAQQSALLRTQLALEDQFYALAVAAGAPTVIVSDRGTMDGRAFCTDAQFQEILRGVGSTVDVLRDRYDAVLHMVTSANGAEEFYNLDNPARYEDLDGARASDLRLQEMYVGHPMFRLLDNSTTFEEKIERGLQIVAQVVHKEQAAPTTPSYYLVRRCPKELPIASATYITYTTVLNNSQMNDIRLLVKREMPDGSSMHFFKSVRDVVVASSPTGGSNSASRAMSFTSGGTSFRSSIAGAVHRAMPPQQRIESAQRISSREYNSLRQHRDRARSEVVMQATHFIFDGANYELTTLLAPRWATGRQTLTVESSQSSSTATCVAATPNRRAHALHLPPFLEVDREVPIESLTTAFLISHRETGALYTSLAFAPVFSRAVVSAIGAHADTENILNSTMSTPRHGSSLRGEPPARLSASPVVAERAQAVRDALAQGVADDENSEIAAAAAVAGNRLAATSTSAEPRSRGLGAINVNTAPNASLNHSRSTPKKKPMSLVPQPQPQPQHSQHAEVPPHFLGGSVSSHPPRNIVTPSRFSLSGADNEDHEVGAAPVTDAAVANETTLSDEHLLADEHRPVVARDPEAVLPPIKIPKVHAA